MKIKNLLFILGTLLITVVIVYALSHKTEEHATSSPVKQDTKHAENHTNSATTPSEKNVETPPEQQIEKESIMGKMVAGVQHYFQAPSVEEKLKYVYDEERVMPLVVKYYNTHPYTPRQVKSMDVPSGFGYNGVSFWRTKVTFTDDSVAFIAMTFDRATGTVKVDWPSEIRYCSQDWDKWINANPDGLPEGDFRVYAQLDSAYTGQFSDQDKYVSIMVTIMGSTRSIIVYADKSNIEQMELIQQIASSTNQLAECTLRLQRVSNPASPKPVAILKKVLSTCWIEVPEQD